VVILIVDDLCIRADEAECQTPVSIDANGPVTLKLAGQRMKTPALTIHISCAFRKRERGELVSQFLGMRRDDPGFGISEIEPFQTFVFEGFDHCSAAFVFRIV